MSRKAGEMSLDHGYGVVIGTRDSYYRDPVNDYGQYYHGNLRVGTPAGVYHCAIDVDSHSQPNGVQWRVVELRPSMLKGVNDLADGWHALNGTEDSGALDYIRNPDLRGLRAGFLARPLGRLLRRLAVARTALEFGGQQGRAGRPRAAYCPRRTRFRLRGTISQRRPWRPQRPPKPRRPDRQPVVVVKWYLAGRGHGHPPNGRLLCRVLQQV